MHALTKMRDWAAVVHHAHEADDVIARAGRAALGDTAAVDGACGSNLMAVGLAEMGGDAQSTNDDIQSLFRTAQRNLDMLAEPPAIARQRKVVHVKTIENLPPTADAIARAAANEAKLLAELDGEARGKGCKKPNSKGKK